MDFDDPEKLTLPCLSCGEQTRKTAAWINDNTEFVCICGSVNRLDTDEFKERIRGSRARVQELIASIRKARKEN